MAPASDSECSDASDETVERRNREREKAKYEREMEEAQAKLRKEEEERAKDLELQVKPEAPLLVQGDGWNDIMDGSVKTRTVVEGSGEIPEMQAFVICSFDVFALAEDGALSPEPLQRYSNVMFKIGEGEACPALELTLRHMSTGSTHEVACIARFAHGPVLCRGIPEEDNDIPPDTRLLQRVVLHEIFEENSDRESDGFWDQRFKIIEHRKKSGNNYFKRKNFDRAGQCYEKGMEVFVSCESFLEDLAAERRDQLQKMFVDCASNTAAVYLERQDGPKAMQACTCALAYSPDNLKVLFRTAKAEYLMANYDECEKWLRDAEKVDPENASVKSLAAQVKRARARHAAEQKKMAKKLVNKVSWGEATAEPSWLRKKMSQAREALLPYGRGFIQGIVVTLIMAVVMKLLIVAPAK